MRFMPFVKGKKGFQMAGGGVSDSGGGGGGYVLPSATSNTLGGVKIGSGVNVTSDGTISVDSGGTLPTYSPTETQVAWYQEVIDGVLKQKPVYETTFDAGSSVGVSYESWTTFKTVTFVPDRIPYAMGFDANKTCYPVMAKVEFGEIKLQTPTNNARSNVRFLVLRYTKDVDEWVTV